ncbi:MAG: MATE family efflux transporter [Oscillospiraceae bacterium]|nr:MATE family efflux transporter [Oscillospiraceae bacterium]
MQSEKELSIDVQKTALFESVPIPRAVMKMAVPTVLSSLVMVIYNLADTYFVGMLNNSVENAAVTLAAPVLLAFNAVINLFGVGGSSLMSRYLGIKRYEQVRKSAAVSFYCALGFSALFSLAFAVFHTQILGILGTTADTSAATWRYLQWTTVCGAVPAILNVVLANLVRAEGSALHASIGTMSGCILNMILDPIFILPVGLHMGAAGAGLATFLSNCAACGYFFVLLRMRCGQTMVCVFPRVFSPDPIILRQICVVGIPAAIQNLLNVTGMTVLNNFTASYGSDAVAAMGISHKINMVPMYIAMGISQGIMPLVGYNYASGNRDRMKKAVLFTAKISVAFIVLVSVAYFAGSRGLIGWFMKNEAVIAYGSRFLRGMCIGLVFLTIDFLAVGVFQACGMGTSSLIFAILRKVVLEIPALFILNKLYPLYGLAYAQTAAEFVLAVATIVLLRRMFRGDAPQKVREEA